MREASGDLFKGHELYTQRQKALQQVRDLLTDDIYDAYRHVGGEEAVEAIKGADTFYRVNMDLDRKYMKSIAKKAGYDSPVKLYRDVENAITGLDTQKIAVVKQRLGGARGSEWDNVVDQYVRDRVITGRGNLDYEGFLKMRDDLGKSASMENLLLGKPGDPTRQYWDDLTNFFEEYGTVMKQAASPLTQRKGAGTFSNLNIYGPLMIGGGAASFASGGSVPMGILVGGTLAAMTPELAWKIVKQPKIMRPLMEASRGKTVSVPARLAQVARISRGLDEDEQAALAEFFVTMGSGLDSGNAQQDKSPLRS